jgi:hypothetical protein
MWGHRIEERSWGRENIPLMQMRGPLPHARLRGFRAAARAHAHHLSARADSGHSVLPGPRHAAWARPPLTYAGSCCIPRFLFIAVKLLEKIRL